MKRIALWIIGGKVKKSADFLDWVANHNPDAGVRLWAAARASSYRHVLYWLRGETELEEKKADTCVPRIGFMFGLNEKGHNQ